MLHVVLLVFFIFFLICGIETYSIGVSPTVKYARVNDTFEISCYIHQAGGKLEFYDGNDLVPESYIKRINDTYITYTNSCSKPMKKNVTCKKEENIVGMSEVFIDDKIDQVKDFKCRTTNLKDLQCSFQQPFNFLPITYRLNYFINDGKKNHCKLQPNWQGGYSCNITVHDDPLNTVLNLTLRAHNEFYKKREIFKLKLMETLLPRQFPQVHAELKKPQNTSLSNLVFIIFTLPRELEIVAQGIMFEVKLKAKDENKWESIVFETFEERSDKEKFLALNNIKFANTIYQFKVRMKAKTSKNIDEMWSTYVDGSFKTHPKLPEMIPKICSNCYSIMDNGNIHLYWTEIPKFFQNGDNFSYLLKIFNPNGNVLLNETFLTKTSFTISNRNVESFATKYIVINIYCSNHVGLSKTFSSINVYVNQTKNLLQIKKEWVDRSIGYKLSWRPYDSIIDIKSYTIIWCRQISELPNQCESSIQFLEVPSYENEFFLNTSYSHQFGIAVNSLNSMARGLQWAKCTSSKPDEIGTLHSLWTKYYNENSILFEWKLNCADKDIVSAFNIQYCVVADFDRNICLEKQIYEIFNVSKERQIANEYQITNLKPYKIYNISIALISTSGRSGAFSKPIMIRTLEGSPTAPRNLEAIDIKSNSISLQWNRPIEVNGPSLSYQLWYNDRMIHIYNDDTMKETFNYQLDNLESYTNYTITVVACTRNCSQPSGSLIQRTKIGKPGLMNQIEIDIYGNGSIQLLWQRPNHLGGFLEFYLLNVSIIDGYETKDMFYEIYGHRNSCIIDMLNCDTSDVFFSIRGINVDYTKSNVQKKFNDSDNCFAHKGKYNEKGYFYGDSSAPITHICHPKYSGFLIFLGGSPYALIITVFFAICLIGVMGCTLMKVYYKLQDMKDIQILWPDGLDPKATFKNDSIVSLKDFDLVKNCSNLEKIREESFRDLELYENPYNLTQESTQETIENHALNVNNKDSLIPLFPKSQTYNVICNESTDNKEKSSTVPNSPSKYNSISNVGYVKMNHPQKSLNSICNSPTGGYLDMSRKSSNPYVNQSHDLNSNDIKSFIQNSQSNNGYIQRKSINNSFPIKKLGGYTGINDSKN